MHDLPYRTNSTWLTDEQLILLDILFVGSASFQPLRQETFRHRWNLAYSHGLDDDELQCNLRWLCEHGVLHTEPYGDEIVFRMTVRGGALWSQERCPVWERFSDWREKTISRGRTLLSVKAVSPRVRDEFLALWPLYPARRRTAVITDYGLIGWHPFGQLFVGVATYEEQREWTPAEYAVWAERYRQHQGVLERECSWWGCVPELQRFVPKRAEPGAAADSPRE